LNAEYGGNSILISKSLPRRLFQTPAGLGPVSKFSDPVDRVDRTGVATGLNYDSACASTAGNRARFRSTVIIPGGNSVQSTGEIEPIDPIESTHRRGAFGRFGAPSAGR
jgi:hypothetical protein